MTDVVGSAALRARHRPWTSAACAFLAVAACGGDEEGSRSAPPAGDSAAVDEAREPRDQGPERFIGILTADGVLEIDLCDGTVLRVDGPATLQLLELHGEFTPGVEPMEGIFVDVLGEIRDAQGSPWLDALEVRRAALEGWGCGRDESVLVLEAAGTEPFWSLKVEGGTAGWSTPDSAEAFAHDGPYAMPRGGWMLEGRDPAGRVRLRAEFYPEPCRNAMSGAYSHLAAMVTVDGVEYRGCGFSGPEADALP